MYVSCVGEKCRNKEGGGKGYLKMVMTLNVAGFIAGQT